MQVALAGFLTGLSLIVAIGAQNAYVLRLRPYKNLENRIEGAEAEVIWTPRRNIQAGYKLGGGPFSR